MATRAGSQEKSLQGPKKNLVFRQFEGLNTQASRQAIGQGEFSWIENVIPIGFANLKIVPARSLALARIPAGKGTCFYMKSFNIANVPYLFMATDAGNAYQVMDEAPNTVTAISDGADEFSHTLVSVAQWQNDRILILDSKGYRSWDGTNLVHLGGVNAVVVTAPSSGYAVAPAVTFGPPNETGGVQATGHTLLTGTGGISEVVIDEPGSGYTSAPSVTFASGAATATAYTLLPTGQNVATFSSRAWLTNNRTWLFTAPISYNNFQLGQGAGSVIETDETLLSNIVFTLPANNFLYWMGDTSINAIGNVQVTSLGATVYSNPNLTDNIGAFSAGCVVSYYRSILVMNRSGIYSVYGATPVKISGALDGIFPKIDFTKPIASGCVNIENQLCAAFFFSYMDDTGTRPLMAIYFNKKWFLASQGNDLVTLCSAYDGLQTRLYATDGAFLYELFNRTGTPVPWKIEQSYWDMDDMTEGKQITKFGFEMNVIDSDGEVNFQIDSISAEGVSAFITSESYSVPVSATVEWINDFDDVIEWDNDSDIAVGWLGNGYFITMQDGSEDGKYIGITMSSSNVTGTIISDVLEYTNRESW